MSTLAFIRGLAHDRVAPTHDSPTILGGWLMRAGVMEWLLAEGHPSVPDPGASRPTDLAHPGPRSGSSIIVRSFLWVFYGFLIVFAQLDGPHVTLCYLMGVRGWSAFA